MRAGGVDREKIEQTPCLQEPKTGLRARTLRSRPGQNEESDAQRPSHPGALIMIFILMSFAFLK